LGGKGPPVREERLPAQGIDAGGTAQASRFGG